MNPKGNQNPQHTLVRAKAPEVDLRRRYSRPFWSCFALSLLLHIAMALLFPRFEAKARVIRPAAPQLETIDLPETHQKHRPPPPPRPAVPVETESADVPDDVTIESTELSFDPVSLDVPPPPLGTGDEEEAIEEVVEFFAVEQEPRLIKNVLPQYPKVAREANLEGSVFVQFVVWKDGTVRDAVVLKGPPIFHKAAIEAILARRFEPALQNDKAVSVRMTQRIWFRFK